MQSCCQVDIVPASDVCDYFEVASPAAYLVPCLDPYSVLCCELAVAYCCRDACSVGLGGFVDANVAQDEDFEDMLSAVVACPAAAVVASASLDVLDPLE